MNGDSPADNSSLSLLQVGSTLPMAPPRVYTRTFLLFSLGLGTILVLILSDAYAMADEDFPLSYWLLPFALFGALAFLRKLYLPRKQRIIRFFEEEIELPLSPNTRRTLRVRYDEIRTIVPLVSRGQPALVIDTPKRSLILVASHFAHPELWRVLMGALIDRIGGLPKGYEQLHRMRDLSRQSQITSSVEPKLTRKFLLLIGLVFGAQLFLAPEVDVLEYIYFGASIPSLVLQEGQWWRVVTANLLHGNSLHFAVNAFALYFLGTFMERLYGRAQTLLLILATALSGAAASLFFSGALASVGLSTALYGLIGAYLALHLRFFQQLPPPYRQTKRWWVVILTLNLGLTFAVPAIDTFGHLGGLVAGIGLGWLLLRPLERFEARPPSRWLTNLSVALLTGLFVFSSFFALSYSLGEHREDEVVVAQALLDRGEDESPLLLAATAHQWATKGTRYDEIDLLLVQIALKSASQSDDPQVRRLVLQTLRHLAETSTADLSDYLLVPE